MSRHRETANCLAALLALVLSSTWDLVKRDVGKLVEARKACRVEEIPRFECDLYVVSERSFFST